MGLVHWDYWLALRELKRSYSLNSFSGFIYGIIIGVMKWEF